MSKIKKCEVKNEYFEIFYYYYDKDYYNEILKTAVFILKFHDAIQSRAYGKMKSVVYVLKKESAKSIKRLNIPSLCIYFI